MTIADDLVQQKRVQFIGYNLPSQYTGTHITRTSIRTSYIRGLTYRTIGSLL